MFNRKSALLNMINVDHDQKIIFIHIPKTAGTSIANLLGFTAGTSHITAKEVKQNLCKKEFSTYFKFCFVRNPWDRFISLYNYARLEESYYHSSVNPEKSRHGKHLDFDLLKNASLSDCADYLLEHKLKHDLAWNHWQEQINWIYDDQGKILVDYIGKFENLEDDIIDILKKIGAKKNLKRMNSSVIKNNRKVLDVKTRDIIKDFYKNDIEKFGYEF